MTFRKLISPFLLVALLLAVGCYNRDVEPVAKQQLTVEATSQAANWKNCQTTYWAIGASTPAFSVSQTAAIQAAFDEFTNIGSTLRFEQRATSPTITIVQSTSATFKASPTPGLLSYAVNSLSYYTVDANKNAVIYLRAEANLTPDQVKAVLMHQIGKLIGLSLAENDPASVMGAPNLTQPLKKLSATDIGAVLSLFGTECPVLLAGTDNLAETIFDNRCGGIPYFIETNKAIYDDTKLVQAIQKAAGMWNAASTFARFVPTAKPDSALIRIRFVPKEQFTQSQVSDGTVSLTMLPLSKLQKGSATGTALILLRQDFKWNENTLRQAVAQQMGYFLGLARSTSPTSVMYAAYRPEAPLSALSADDKTMVETRLGSDCPLLITIDAEPLKLVGVKYFGRRVLTYLAAPASGVTTPAWANTAVSDAFKTFTNAGFIHQFSLKSATDPDPTFSISFVPASVTGKDVVANVKYREIAGMDGYTILLNWEIAAWTQPRLQAVLTHVIGAVLGLPVSANENEIMFGTLRRATLSLSGNEIAALKAIYTFNNTANLVPTAPGNSTAINTQNIPNCVVRCYTSAQNTASSIPVDAAKAMTILNNYLPTTRFANAGSPPNNYSIYFWLSADDLYANALRNSRVASTRIHYNQLCWLYNMPVSGIRYNHQIYVNSNEPQLKSNAGAGFINLQLYCLGKLIGLPDSDDPASIMYPYVSTTVKQPTADDGQKLRTAFANCQFGPVAAGWRKVAESYFPTGFAFPSGLFGCNGNQVVKIDPTTKQLSSRASLPTSGYTAFASQDKLYLFGGVVAPSSFGDYTYSNNLYEFDPVSERLTKLSSLPSTAQGRQSAAGFVIDGKCYIAGGYSTKPVVDSKGNQSYTSPGIQETWVYDPGNGRWSQVKNSPFLYNGNWSTTYAGKGYVFYANTVNVYTPATDSWSALSSYPSTQGGMAPPWQIGDYVYALSNQSTNEFYRFDLRQGTWGRLPDPNIAPPITPFGSFTSNGKGYVSASPLYTPSKPAEVWEYTPQ